MARYNANERSQIIEQMQSEVRDCLKKYGVRKTSVDELVKRVNIPKGTFYLFFPTKEDLIYDVICQYRQELLESLLSKLEREKRLNTDSFSKIVYETFCEASNSFLVEIERNNEMDFLFRKLPKDKVEKQEKEIDRLYHQLRKFVSCVNDEEFEILLTASLLLFKTTLVKESIDEQVYYNSVKLLINGISLQCISRGVDNDVPTKGSFI